MNASTSSQSHIYIHPKSESFTSRLFKLVLRLGRFKTRLGRIIASGKFKNEPAPLPKSFPKKYNVEISTFAGRELWVLGPKESASDQVVFYIPGGGYVFNLESLHWTFVGKLIDRTGATVVMANYPVAPSVTAATTYDYMHQLYRKVLQDFSGKEIIFIGDSAGGGLALAFGQEIRDQQLQLPSQIITLSPWLDVTMTNPDIPGLERVDHGLNGSSLRKAGKLYAGDIPTTDPKISPIYGDFQGLGKLSIFMGAHDLFIADARKLRKRLEQEGIPFRYYEYPKMIHTWMLVPTGEAKATLEQVEDLMKG